ncbi:membrane protein required for colicin V production [Lutimaribacter pacificus]|uniref:Membrane protein required for colicin V production n=1 Tax=Lutimaribacter pacificus TaxID=391948 RepID=A0A1H0AU19_9RHOB|nr:CvpA family protein [Lutimaribacter pacificus]SDN36978.1 membrane protein required for colicin V production [Lutimaribacter pacificus]SHJ64772.1 membrane protein required for colicin V production [Lutimaribacter pacificus]
MEGFTIIDGVVALVIIVSALLAYARGFVREALAIAGWIVAGILAFVFAPQVQPLVREVPVVGAMLADSCELSIIAAFAAVFAVALVVASLFTPLFSSVVQRSALGGIDQGVGFLFGVLRGILLVAVAYFVYETVITSQDVAMIDDSRSARVFSRMTQSVESRNPEAALGWITAQYEQLVGVCEAPVTE